MHVTPPDQPQEQPLNNSPEARTPTGELKDLQTPNSDLKENGSEKVQTPEEKTAADAAAAAAAAKKPEEPKLGPDGKPLEEKKAPTGAPEAYADFKAPDGFEIDKALVEKAAPLFKELNLNQEQAQKLVDFHAAQAKAQAEAPYKLWEDTQATWRKEAIADPVIGNGSDGIKPEVKETISRALDIIGQTAPEIVQQYKDAMDLTGAGNKAAFIRVAFEMAKAFTEGKPVKGANPSEHGQARPGAQVMGAKALYPNNP